MVLGLLDGFRNVAFLYACDLTPGGWLCAGYVFPVRMCGMSNSSYEEYTLCAGWLQGVLPLEVFFVC